MSLYVSYLEAFPIHNNLNFFMLASFNILIRFWIPGLCTSFWYMDTKYQKGPNLILYHKLQF